VDIAWLAAFRILFGLLMAAGMIRFLAKGWVWELYLLPRFHFPYPGLEWIRPFPDPWLYAHFVGLAVLGLMIAAGLLYRVAIVLFFIGFAYVELLDQTAYLNHYYLVSLLCGLLIFLPANRAFSLDVLLRPSKRLQSIPAWMLYLLRFQVAVVYVYAGLAKVNPDWLLNAQPLRIWLAARSDLPLIGPWLVKAWVAYAGSWFGAFYDLTIVCWLLWRRTRWLAFAAVIFFHVGTWLLFHIGMFPWIMIAASTLFFDADWPRRLWQRVNLGSQAAEHCSAARSKIASSHAPASGHAGAPRLRLAVLIGYGLVQVLLPLRPYLLGSGHPAWSYRGFNFAWQVMVAEKTGYAEFYARDRLTGLRRRVPTDSYITRRQESLMAQDPYLIRQLAQAMQADLARQDLANWEITVNAYATLNGRPSQPIVDPQADLATSSGSDWILPLRDVPSR
jgi:vitamin K-dependent gamma-carboxylase